ncbi:hypothetical protein [Desertimonas flava]|uniref:hypothetical protein n=1 Tax=Desertimonas flava TaxID=2064846 RepID=UPI000E345CEE|nr:hypothetical protein [Desertimonas flava]
MSEAAFGAATAPQLFDVTVYVEQLPDRLLPFDPLLEAWGAHMGAIADAMHVDVRTVQRWRATGLSYDLADELAVRAGLHAFDVWGDLWFVGTDLETEAGDDAALAA